MNTLDRIASGEWSFARPAGDAPSPRFPGSAAWAGLRPPRWSPGPDGAADDALELDGYDSALRVEDGPALDARESLVIEAVFSAATIDDFAALLWKGIAPQDDSRTLVSYWLGLRRGRPAFRLRAAGGRWIERIADCPPLAARSWHHLFVRFEAGQLDGLLDGRPLRFSRQPDAEELPSELPDASGLPLWIGDGRMSCGFRGHFFHGALARLRVSVGDASPVFPLPPAPRPVAVAAPATPDAAPGAWRVSVASSLEKILPGWRPAAATPTGIALELAGNEYESAQLVLQAGAGREDAQVSVRVGPLRAPGGEAFPGTVRLSRVDYVETRQPSYETPHVGWWPDPLWPLAAGETLRVGPERPQPVWISVHAPAGTAPGIYRGELELEGAGLVRRVPVSLRVRAFSLPERFGLPVSFSFDENLAARYYGQERLSDRQRALVHEVLARYRVGVADIYSTGMYPASDTLASLPENALSAFTAIYCWRKNRLADPEVRARFERDIASLRALGLTGRAQVYGYDEITHRRELFAPCREDYGLAARLAPELPRMMTGAPIPELADLVDIWNVPLNVWHESIAEEIRASGKKMWLYTAGEGPGDIPDLLLDIEAIKHRILFWLLWKYRADGYLIWRINRGWKNNAAQEPASRWPARPWDARLFNVVTGRWSEDNANGNLIWPHPAPDQPPLAGIRLELVRDGLEDHEYLRRLAGLRDALETAAGKDGTLAAPAALARLALDRGEALVRTPRDYVRDPAALFDARREIADAIEAAEAALAASAPAHAS